MATGPLFAAITAMGRPEYELLLQAGLSLAGLSNVACGDRRGVEWIVVSDGLQYPPRPATAPRELTRAKAGTQPNPLALIRDVAHQAGVPVTVLTNPGPPGPGPARNAGLDRVAAPWIITLDSDDTILPQGMCALLQAIETTPEAAWAAGRCPHTDKEGRRIWDGPTDHFTPGPIEPHSFWKAKLQLGGLPFLCTATLASTAAIRSVGGWPQDNRRRAEDTALWAVLTSRYRGVWVPDDVYLYRRHRASVTHQPGFREADERLDAIAAMIAAGTTRLNDQQWR